VPEILRPWSKPQVVDRLVRLPGRAGFAGGVLGPFQGVIEATGHWSCCDLWLQLPQTWLDVTFRVLALTGGLTTILDTRALTDIENPLLSAPTVGVPGGAVGTISGILLSVRGRACDRFRVEASYTSVDHAQGRFRLSCWGEDGFMGDRDGRIPIAPFAGLHQQANFPRFVGGAPAPPLVAGVTLIFGASVTGGRTNITRVVWSNTERVPQLLSLQTRNPTTAIVTVRAHWRCGIEDCAIVEEFTYPLRSDRGDSWEAVLSGVSPGADHRLNVTGYVD
jgi:hypothetical protein